MRARQASGAPGRTMEPGAGSIEDHDDLPSLRRFPLPQAPARGRIIVPEQVAHATVTALHGFCGPDGRHEGIVFWAGRCEGLDQLIAAAVVPAATHVMQARRREVLDPAAGSHEFVKHAVECAEPDREMTLSVLEVRRSGGEV